MFERTSILGGIRLVCPYHVEKKPESKNSWGAILSSVGALVAMGCLVYRNREKFQFRSCNATDVPHDNDDHWVVDFDGDLERSKKNKEVSMTRSELARSLERRGYVQRTEETVQSWVNTSSELVLGIPLSSCAFPTGYMQGATATAPPVSDFESVHSSGLEVPGTHRSNHNDYSIISVHSAGSEVPRTHRSNHSDYSIISVDREPLARESDESYLAVERQRGNVLTKK